MPAAAHPYFMSISHRIQLRWKMIAGHWSSFHRGIKTSPVIWALYRDAWLRRVASEASAVLSPARCLEPYWSVAVWLWLQNQLFLLALMTKWIQTHCNHFTVRTCSVEDTPAESILRCLASACFTLPIATKRGRSAFSFLSVLTTLGWLGVQRSEAGSDPFVRAG